MCALESLWKLTYKIIFLFVLLSLVALYVRLGFLFNFFLFSKDGITMIFTLRTAFGVFYLNTERVNFLISSSTPWLCVWCLNLPVQGCFYVCDSHSTIELFQSIIFKPWELMHTHSHTHILRGTNFTRENICAYVISVDMQMPIKIIYLRNRNI